MRDYPAHPCDMDSGHHTGMSMRDYFASSALQGLIDLTGHGTGDPEGWPKFLAKRSYEIADEMLREANKRYGLQEEIE